MTKQIQLHGGKAVADNYPDERLELDKITHIVAATSDFPDYHDAAEQFKSIVKPNWVEASLASNRLANPRRYSPDPNLFMSDVVVTCAGIPLGDSEAIAGGVLAMGGNYSAKLTTQTTHIVTLSMDNEKVEQAQSKNLPVAVVLPHWFDDCLKLGKRIDEGPYSFPDPEIQRRAEKAPMGKSNKDLIGASDPDPSSTSPHDPRLVKRDPLKVFKTKRVLFDKDLKISDLLRSVLEDLITNSGGKIVNKVSGANILICKYRAGDNYVAASEKRIDVGNLAWLFHLIVHDKWTSPFRRLMHYPVPKQALPAFESLKISLSNYAGEARTYLENLVTATGAECTKTLKQDNTHLITAHSKSEKVSAAKDWNIHVINHLWLEESYAKWEMQSVTHARYGHFPDKTNLGEVVGQTQIDRSVIERKFLLQDQKGIDAAPNRRKPIESKVIDRSSPVRADPRPAKEAQTPSAARPAAPGKENMTPTTVGSRRSKEAAASKLHNMATDIALFEKERKRVGGVVYGGRRKADEDRIDSSRKRSAEPAGTDDDIDQTATKRQRVESPTTKMHLVITGYKPWVGKPKKEDEETSQLRDLGIAVVDHPSKASHIAAPSFVRTSKVLVAIAYHPVFLSTDYIEACLEKGEYLNPTGYELKDKANEKKFGVSLKDSLARSKTNEGQLLKGWSIYCLERINGGLETYQTIAEANGASFTPYRGRHMAIPSRRAESENIADDSADNEVILLSNTGKEDSRMWAKFLKSAEESRRKARVLNGEWLLSSALRQEIQDFEAHELKP